jgi:pimeloyl-ACP methyl ester carboxylesterase
MDEYRRGDLTFDVLERGPTDGPPVVLLHGFPQFNTSWIPVMDRLAAQGYHCVAPNQRGYSPRARPRRRRDYVAKELVGDVVALIDALGVPKAHLVGHDWGATVAWAAAALAPDRLATMTILSVPHPAAFFKSLVTSRQGLASWYIYFFQLPWIPEWFLRRRDGKGLKWMIGDYAGQAPDAFARDAQAMAAADALTPALTWYRSIPFNKPSLIRTKTTVPTLFIWSDGDKALLESGARDTANYVTADYQFEVVRGASHWMPDECPDRIADLLLKWFAAHPIQAAKERP